MRNTLLLPVAVCICAGYASSAQAQFLDEAELRQEGANAIANIRFVTPVQYLRSTSARASDMVQAFYNVLPSRDPVTDIPSELRLAGGAGIPSIIISDEVVNNTAQAKSSRKLVIRFDTPVKFRLRAGRDSRSIELVLEGLGASVKKASGRAATVSGAKTDDVVPISAPASTSADAGTEQSGAALLAAAQSAFDGGQYDAAIELLNQLLNMSTTTSSRRAQELIGLARLNAGDADRSASEFDLFLKLYPVGDDSDRVRQLAAALPTMGQKSSKSRPAAEPMSTTSGSVSMFYYGGKSEVRTQEFQDSVLASLPVLQSDNTLSGVDQRQLQTNVDLNWRYRDDERDMRFVFRNANSADMIKDVNKNRLSALYFDSRSLVDGTSYRVGRQSPNGGGVLYRFDGLRAGYIFQPKWKVNAVIGTPSDPLLDTRRTFYGLSVDAQALSKELSGSAFLIEQVIDGETDRRGVGADLRYFKGGTSASAQFDYDLVIQGVNVAALQANWQLGETTMVNAMYDRRTVPILSLGNMLFFQNPALLAPAQRIQELLGTTSIEVLREQVKGLTAYQTQARIGGTTAIASSWQVGADLSMTSVDEIKPVVDLLPDGQPSTGNLWSLGVQLIGTNLYSARDTHVVGVSFLGGPTYHGTLLTYNNLSSLSEAWQLEPAFKYYTQSDNAGASNDIWTVGLRAIYRIRQQVSLETELTYERSKATAAPSLTGPGSVSATDRMTYYVGARYDF